LDYFELKIEYQGHCPVSLVENQTVIFGNLNYGIYKGNQDNKCYVFKNFTYAEKFFEN